MKSDGCMQKANCPKCDKRIFGIQTDSEEKIVIETRCQNCRKIVKIHWEHQKDK